MNEKEHPGSKCESQGIAKILGSLSSEDATITKQKISEKDLKRAADIVGNIQLGLHIYHLEDINDDTSLRMISTNEAATSILKIPAADIVGKTLDQNFPGLRAKGIPQKYAEVVKTGKPIVIGPIEYGDQRIKKAIFSLKAFPLADNCVGVSFEDISDRIEASRALRESEERLKAIFAASPAGLALYDKDFRFLLVNKAMASFHDVPVEMHAGKKVTEILPKDGHIVEDLFRKILETEEAIPDLDISGEVGSRPGETSHFLASYFPIAGDDGRPASIGAVVIDMTERKRAEKNLLKSEKRLRSITENAADCIFVKDEKRRYTFVNHAFQTLLNLPEESILGKAPEELFGPDQGQVIKNVDDRTFAGETVNETRRLVLNDKEYFFNTLQTPLDLIDGKVVSIMGIVRDITEHMQTLEKLTESESNLRDSQRLAHLGNWKWDIQTGKVAWSDEVYRIFGLDPKSFNPDIDSVMKKFHPEDKKVYEEVMRNAIEDRKEYSFEPRIILPDGNIRHVFSTSKGHYSKDGSLTAISGIVQDITDIKRTQEELQKTQRLESLGILAGGIAHDFNNLLGGILGNIDLARQELDDNSEAALFLDSALKAYDRARDLTQQLLTFAKGGTPKKTVIELQHLLDETLALALSGSKIHCKSKISDTLKAIHADENQLSQVINNIILNARQAMPNGGTIHVAIKNRILHPNQVSGLPAGEFVELSVRDEGNGIPQSLLTKVFDPFFTTKDAGSGLGLATCHSIIRKHNGAITIDSEVGHGTTVKIFLPVSDMETNVTNMDEPPLTQMSGRVLLMDDEEVMRDVAGAMLRLQGFDVVYTKNGREAIDVFKMEYEAGRKFDALLLDLTVPGGIGGEMAMAEILKIDPGAIGIVTSGYSDSHVLSNPEKYGFWGKIEKPFRKIELSRVLKSILNKNFSNPGSLDTLQQ